MLDERFINFFEKIKLFKEEQKKQKQRGLNDYNMVNVVRKENAEVGMHSNVIYSLIDPNGLHYQDDLFLKIFIKDVLEINDFGDILSVQAEESTNENRRVDFTIKSNNYYIGIEMKVDASDLENQISHYYDDLKEKASKDSNQEVIIYYLTKNGKDASLHSHNNEVKYRKISFEKHILKSEGLVLVDFWAPWCGPCKTLGPILDSVSEKVNHKIAKVNVDEEGVLANNYKIRSIPTMIVFKDGQIIDTIVGVVPEKDLINKLNSY